MGNYIGYFDSTDSSSEIRKEISMKFPEALTESIFSDIPKKQEELVYKFSTDDIMNDEDGFIVSKDNDLERKEVLDVDKEIENIDYLLQMNPYNDILWLTKAKCYMIKKNYKYSVTFCNMAIEKNRKFQNAYYLKIKCLYMLKLYKEALITFNELLDEFENDNSILLNKGLFYSNIKEYKNAIEIFDQIIKKDPNKIAVYYCKGNTLFNMGKVEEADKCYEKCLENDPKNLNFLVRRAVTCSQTNKFQETKEIIDEIENIINENDNQINTENINKNKKYDITKIKEYLESLKVLKQITEIREGIANDLNFKVLIKLHETNICKIYLANLKKDKVIARMYFYNDLINNNKTIHDLKKFCSVFSNKNSFFHNVVEIIDCYSSKKDNEVRIITAYYENDNLKQFLIKEYSIITIRNRLNMISQITKAIVFLIDIKIYSFEINSLNFIVDKERNVYLIDIGLNQFFKRSEDEDKNNKDNKDNNNCLNMKKLFVQLYNLIIEIIKIPNIDESQFKFENKKGIVPNIPDALYELLIKMKNNIIDKIESVEIDQNDLSEYINLLNNI